MSVKSSIQVKAAYLLLVFSLNTIVGFACAAGLDMGFNAKHRHHHDDDHVSFTRVSNHQEFLTQHHEEELNKNYKSTDDDNCCNNGVVKLSQSDKLLTHVVSASIETPVSLVLLHSLYLFYLNPTAEISRQIRVFRRGFFNSPDIRVSIRSFQI
jgi:hypothetical protein